ncbi:MAG TPA: IPT/TIG domain-containing protein [Solirubrobacteraceae bacterium]|nr:IPT/TIG domain-containing protein [Solirubrobacteraceae bacterium]
MRRTGLLGLLIALGVLLSGASAASAAQRVLGWGSHSGSLAQPFDVPTPLSGLEGAIGGAAGGRHNLVLLAGGTVAGWGNNLDGALGTNPGPDQTPVPIEGLSGVQALAAGIDTSYALMEGGTVEAWGRGSEGQLGNGGKTLSQPTPVEVPGLEGVTAIAAGGYRALALLEGGTVVQWGAWYPSGAIQSTPVAVAGLTNVKAIAVGQEDAYALLGDGTVKAWGYEKEGALGNGNTGPGLNETPTSVSGLTEVQAIAAGGNSAIALREDGTVLDWGSNDDGKLGPGKYSASNVPVSVAGVSEAKAVAMGAQQTFALRQDGSLLAWGGGGAVGAGDFGQHPTPVPVCGGQGVLAIFAGGIGQNPNEVTLSSSFAIAVPGPLCPEFDSSKPGWGKPGTTVTLKGINLEETSSVLVGGSPASFTALSPTEIEAVTPPGTGEVPLAGLGPAGSFGFQSPGLFDYVEAPSFGRCVRSFEYERTEEFPDDFCTKAGAGKGWEWEPLPKGSLTSVAKKPVVLETGGVKVTCKSETGTGALTSNKAAGALVWTLVGCERLGQPCSSSGAPSGSIVSEPLQGSLAVYKPGAKGNKVKDKAGLVISPVASGGPVARFSCGSTSSIVVSGAVIGQLLTNKTRTSLKMKFAVKKGAQEPSSVPGGPSDVLSTSVEGGSAQASTLVGGIALTIKNGGLVGVNTIAYD